MICSITESNCSKFRDCGPSESACAGSLCTSIIRPSAPQAIPALASGSTKERTPVAWLGSTMTGRWVRSFKTHTALKSKVFLVEVSKVRIPRSHNATFGLPEEIIYSAAFNHSSIVADRPLFNKTGRPARPTSFNNSKFCIFLAPT